ncbi:hypothetical protein P6144_13010 [Sphingomonas sp. HITSZ_GF]|uniref:hypothetical protein n=1 Tax=Sphingomonas sp. HITSZ_GF TaxID=3037247 RepID=UPI00240D773F|nr:hypothetical protein [Sphingomonas sp. HITSZ_GF]MDG2534574.1 hypothetical protein [Sphingomonas sp. HITSZ_GF]
MDIAVRIRRILLGDAAGAGACALLEEIMLRTLLLSSLATGALAVPAIAQTAPDLGSVGDQARQEVRDNWRDAAEKMRNAGKDGGAVRGGADAGGGAARSGDGKAGDAGGDAAGDRSGTVLEGAAEGRLMMCFTMAMGSYRDEDFPTPFDTQIAEFERRIVALSPHSMETGALEQIESLGLQQGKLKVKASEIRQPRMEAAAARKCGGRPKSLDVKFEAPAKAADAGPSDAAIDYRAKELVKLELETEYRSALDTLETALREGGESEIQQARAELEKAEQDYRKFLGENAPEALEKHNDEWNRSLRPMLMMKGQGGAHPGETGKPPVPELDEYDGPDGPGEAGSPEERALREDVQRGRQALEEARERLNDAEASGDKAAVTDAKQIFKQAQEDLARRQDKYSDYKLNRPQATSDD